jgi:hypothetical protein
VGRDGAATGNLLLLLLLLLDHDDHDDGDDAPDAPGWCGAERRQGRGRGQGRGRRFLGDVLDFLHLDDHDGGDDPACSNPAATWLPTPASQSQPDRGSDDGTDHYRPGGPFLVDYDHDDHDDGDDAPGWCSAERRHGRRRGRGLLIYLLYLFYLL